MIMMVSILGSFATKFRMDASADTLVLETDQSLKYYRSIKAKYGSDDFLVVTYSPKADLFNQNTLSELQNLHQALSGVSGVSSVVSILNVPLIQSPPVTLAELSNAINTLMDGTADPKLAKNELVNSPLYRDMLISADASTTAIQVNLTHDVTYQLLLDQRDDLYLLRAEGHLSDLQQQQLDSVNLQISAANAKRVEQQAELIANVRSVMQPYQQNATLYLGGVPMIAADSIAFIANDLVVFGIGVLVFLIATLIFIFRQLRWVVLPLLTCVTACISMLGILGWLDWPVTVVSSNFISLMLIITLSLTIHLIVRYQEFQKLNPTWTSKQLVIESVKNKVVPCVYTAITTMVAFGSLLVSGIRPVIDFGWMMVIGLAVAFILSFTLFPAIAVLLSPKPAKNTKDFTISVSHALAKAIKEGGIQLLTLFVAIIGLSAWGISQLSVENRFIDYYKSTTEIHRGMLLIDKQLGGTTPLDVIIDAPIEFFAAEELESIELDLVEEEMYDEEDEDLDFDLEDLEDEESETVANITASSYWFNMFQLPQVIDMHNYLESLPETGKVMSIASSIKLLRLLDKDIAEDNFLLALFHQRLPESIKQALLLPYMSEDGNQIRFSIRVFESDSNLNRQQLLAQIQSELATKFDIAPERIHVSGMLVLYNNLLQSLFKSQILTIGVVFLVIMLMFFVLFRNIKLSIIAITPNMMAAALVLGIMGIAGIPLDIMTITIAAIVIGIAVDNSIHYVYRFKEEYALTGDYSTALNNSHLSIGKALYYTSITVTLGFSILVLSNFIPTMYFGVLTGFSMLIALLANLTLLPLLMVKLKAFG